MINIRAKRHLYTGLSAIVAVVLSLYTVSIWTSVSRLSSEIFLHINVVVMLLVYLFAFIAWGRTGHKYTTVYMMFLIYGFTSNAGQFFIRFIDPNGVFSFTSLFSGYSNETLTKVAIFQSACIACLNCGALIGAGSRLSKDKEETVASLNNKKDNSFSLLGKIVFILLLLLVLYDAISFFQVRRSMSYAEGVSVETGLGTYTSYIFSVLMLYLMFSSEGKRLRTLMLTVGFISALYFLSGTRSRAIPLLSSLAIIARLKYPKLFNRKNILIAIPLLFLGLAITSAIAFTRTSSIGTIAITGVLSEKGILYLVKQALYEMGMSARTVALTIQSFESAGMQHQQTILYCLVLAVIPRPLLLRIGITAPTIGSLSAFATGGNTSGAGFSFLAEFYFNFGLWAVIPMFLYGFVITRLESIADENVHYGRFLFAAAVYTILCKQIFFARGQFDYIYNYLRNTVYLMILWWIFSGGLRTGKIRIRRGRPDEQG